jgi:hypothetical protein
MASGRESFFGRKDASFDILIIFFNICNILYMYMYV